jgi:hypothetical protein
LRGPLHALDQSEEPKSSGQVPRDGRIRLMLALRLIGPNDYSVLEDGQLIGRIRLARDRTPPIWLWNVTLTIPSPPFGDGRRSPQSRWTTG